MLMFKDKNRRDVVLIFTPYITRKDGTRLYAKQFGKKAFCFPKPVNK